jgi:hypothetical protein
VLQFVPQARLLGSQFRIINLWIVRPLRLASPARKRGKLTLARRSGRRYRALRLRPTDAHSIQSGSSIDLRASQMGDDLLAKKSECFAASRRDASAQHREKVTGAAFAALIDDLFCDLSRRSGDVVVVM